MNFNFERIVLVEQINESIEMYELNVSSGIDLHILKNLNIPSEYFEFARTTGTAQYTRNDETGKTVYTLVWVFES